MRMHVSAPMFAAIGLTASVCAVAGSVHVMPTTLTLPPGKATAVITVTNEGKAPANVQVRVFAWDQQGNRDNLNPTQKVVASPPMVTLAPKQTQAIRVVRVEKSAATAEEAYRLLVDEIPDTKNPPQVGIAVQMRYSVPVFVLPRADMPAGNVTVTAQLDGGTLSLHAQNQGQAHVQAANVSIEHAGGTTTPVVPGLLGYVLPGQAMQWTLDVPANAAANGRPVRAVTQLNGQEVKVDL